MKAGFVNIIGNPNVGKSTLMNALVGERLSIITSKAQTTRKRVMGIVNGDDFQIVYTDTPGIVTPSNKLHEQMMGFVGTALQDADLFLLVTEVGESFKNSPAPPPRDLMSTRYSTSSSNVCQNILPTSRPTSSPTARCASLLAR